ncbi:Dinitrogenase iron-molybdenum cofactor [Actinomyces bovis]|uniref:Dinitrogenase iron-molybdenum cofactor n=1 Tax=Actinomyces bovis TaxID=1658 RepID=A0ABY1VLJ9_9ACTO|nr:NifB/NifX family molybdenum-iron cluster-binding protein [Actinomyces bovis]SPT52547.1 Dinitrogenase iron-molybdenum cofactor [Actinomyces bovis]VEG54308.1 Dinitrogenase iron-molybdenum cofactor [Actinomyces israelii]
MSILVPVTADGQVEARFGRTPLVAIVQMQDGAIVNWTEHAVGWDTAHDSGTEGAHHARIVRFLREQEVDTVVATHMGMGMQRVTGRMGIRLLATDGGPARQAVLEALATPRELPKPTGLPIVPPAEDAGPQH